MPTKRDDALVFIDLLLRVNDQVSSREDSADERETLRMLQQMARDLLAPEAASELGPAAVAELLLLVDQLWELDYADCRTRLNQLANALRAD